MAVVGFSVCVFGVCWGGAGLAGMVAQVPLSVLLLVLACMSVVLHYFPLKSQPARFSRSCQSFWVPAVNYLVPSLYKSNFS